MLRNKYYIILACLLSFNGYAEPNEDQMYPYPYNQQTSAAREQAYPYSPLPTQVYPNSQQSQDYYPYGQRSTQIYYGYNQAPGNDSARSGAGCSCGR